MSPSSLSQEGTGVHGNRLRCSSAGGLGRVVAATCLNLLIIWLLNAGLVPGVNESHYLPKAKHAWNPQYAPGDLFLASGNAHWLFAQLAGWLSTFMSLTAVAWIGRVASWMLMALAWQRLADSLRLPMTLSALVLSGWILAVRFGNWAGEWAVGGFEAKSLAYPFVIWALAHVLAHRWSRAWLPIGIAIAFHPLVGGWAGLTIFAAWLAWGRRASPLRSQVIPTAVAGAVSLIGIVPALSMIGGPSRSGDIVVAQIHAFYRLAHHQSPRLFAPAQHVAGACSLFLFIIASAIVVSRWRSQRKRAEQSTGVALDYTPLAMLVAVAWFSLAISLAGLFMDTVVVRVRPDVAAGLLRFYWFRWSDVAVPLAWVSGFWAFGLEAWRASAGWRLGRGGASVTSGQVPFLFGLLPGTLLALWTVAAIGKQVSSQWDDALAPADRTVLMSGSAELASGPEVVGDWQKVCAWIAEHTPTDALFLTPRAQQTFKWYAGRAEVVCYKDVPQDSRSLLEWYDRVGRCAPPRDANGQPLGWTTEQLRGLQARYHFQYVVVDRRIQREPPLLEMVYPDSMLANGTYAIFKFSRR